MVEVCEINIYWRYIISKTSVDIISSEIYILEHKQKQSLLKANNDVYFSKISCYLNKNIEFQFN